MTALVPIMLFGWIPVVFMFFAALPPRRAVITAFLSAWMFLPIYGYDLPGLPAYNKMSATCAGIFLAAAVYDFKSLRGFRLRWFDLPMLAWCLSPMPSSIFNGIGVYEGLSGVQYEFVSWGMPYLIGRLYFGTIEALVDLAIGIFIGGLVYIPLVLIEMRFSPQLHTWVYGFHQHVFAQAKKAGGWRPTVFMQHGLAVANFMGGAAVIGLALWYTQRLRRWKGLPMWLLVLVLWVVFALCRSSGALVLAVFGGAMLLAAWKLKTRVPIYAAMALPILYMVARTVGGWNGHEVVDIARYFADEKADSVLSRLHSETGLWHEVQGRLIFGAGRFGWAGEVVDGYKIIPDGLWIIALGKRGFVGLIAITLALLTPAWLFVRRWPTFTWTHPLVGPAASMAVLLVMYMADNLSNAMLNPIFMLGAGGLPMVSEHALALARQPRGGPRATAGRPVGAAAMRPAAGVAPARPAPGAARAEAMGRLADTVDAVMLDLGLGDVMDRLTPAPGAVVLMYHSVADESERGWIDPANDLAPLVFFEQMRFLAEHRRVLSMSELVTAMEHRVSLPPGSVAITFDDGYLNNLRVVTPILKRLGLPATLYLPTGSVDRVEPQWVDRLHAAWTKRTAHVWSESGSPSVDLRDARAGAAARAEISRRMLVGDYAAREALLAEVEARLRPAGTPPRTRLTWDEVRLMVREHPGWEVGVHTETHRDLSSCGEDEARREIEACVAAYRREMRRPPDHFSFPYGRSTERTREMVRTAGLRSAVAVKGREVRSGSDPFWIPRVESPASARLARARTSASYPALARWAVGR